MDILVFIGVALACIATNLFVVFVGSTKHQLLSKVAFCSGLAGIFCIVLTPFLFLIGILNYLLAIDIGPVVRATLYGSILFSFTSLALGIAVAIALNREAA